MLKEFYIHRIFLMAISLISSFLISPPIAERGSLWTLLLAFALVAVLYALISRLKQNKLLLVICSILALVYVVIQSRIIVGFFSANALPKTPKFLIAFIFALCVFYGALMPKTALLKLALLSFGAVALAVVIVFCFSFGELEFSGFSRLAAATTNGVKDFLGYFLRFFPVVLLPFFANRYEKDSKRDELGLFLGLLLASSIFLLMGSNTHLNNQEYPFFFAADIISVGSIFTRISGVVYLAFFLISFIKVTELLHIAKDGFNLPKNGRGRFLCGVLVTLTVVLPCLI